MNRKQRSYLFTVILLAITLYTIWPKGKKEILISQFAGITMGTIQYQVKVVGASVEYQSSIDSILVAFNEALSTYVPTSEISTFNKDSKLDQPSRLFQEVFTESSVVYEKTNGSFDPTIGPLINIWGFGPNKTVVQPDSAKVDSLLLLVGFEKIFNAENTVSKDTGMYLDFSAIAKGQAVDEVGKWLESKGITNYMVEIGGEVRCRGLNQNDTTWRIGIQDPRISDVNEQIAIASLGDLSVATSGNYRNYYEKDGIIRAHIVDPVTGYTAEHNLLSASVFHKNCMTADAYATAFMVMGLEKSIALVESDPELDALFVYQSGDELDIYVSGGISDNVDILLE